MGWYNNLGLLGFIIYTYTEEAMIRIKCEVCGSSDIIKNDGKYSCQNCGANYSYEEAKKRAYYLKRCIEDNDVYRLFYDTNVNIRFSNSSDPHG